MDTSNEILDNINNKTINEVKNFMIYKFDIIYNSSYLEQFILRLIERLKYDPEINTNNYKKINTFPYYDIIYKFIPKLENFIKIKILINISKCMYGLKILNKIPNIDTYLTNNNIEEIVSSCSDCWTFPVFLYYLNLIKQRNLNINSKLIIDCFCNSDDRIYKYVVDNNDKLKLLNYNEDIINSIISVIFMYNGPVKYILRRLKYLHKLFPNIGDKHFNYIIDKFYGDLYSFDKVIKYYYFQPFSDSNINKLIEHIISSNNIVDKLNYYYNLLKTTTEKNKFVISTLFIHGTNHNLQLIDGKNDFNNLRNLITNHLESLLIDHSILHSKYNVNDFRNFVNNIGFHNVSSCLIISNSFYVQKDSIMFLLPFLVAEGDYGIYFNRLRYYISKFIKNVRRKKQIIHKLKIFPIINELKSLDNKSSVFNKLRNNKKQLFNNIPPYHLYPGQLNSLNISCLLKEKADGVLVNNIPTDITPIFPFKNKIKAEYIEDLDLYLVFDIDEERTIEDRHLLIHNKHKYGQKSIPIINNEDEMINEINQERLKLKEFLKETYDNYRWYPKPAWKINNITNFIIPFNNIINDSKFICDWIINKNYNKYVNNDGLILTPLNGDREIKIKPKSLYTIDLLYLNNKWLDRDGYEWDINIKDKIEDNTIWRCYPLSNYKFEAREIRYDKTKPNTHEVVSIIMDLYNMDYQYEYPRIYNTNDNHHYNIMWKKVIDDNNKILQMMLNNINTNAAHNASHINILDCGCGSGRTIKYLNKFNKYIGVDIDMNMLGSSINNTQSINNIHLMYCDLNKSWPLIIMQPLRNFDLVICLSSIMHFMTDVFWENLNKVTDKSTKMLINIVDIDDNFRYDFDEYFIERKQNKIYYKFPIHNSIMEENYVDIKKINEYGWNVIETFKPNYDNLTKHYKWYVLIKN